MSTPSDSSVGLKSERFEVTSTGCVCMLVSQVATSPFVPSTDQVIALTASAPTKCANRGDLGKVVVTGNFGCSTVFQNCPWIVASSVNAPGEKAISQYFTTRLRVCQLCIFVVNRIPSSDRSPSAGSGCILKGLTDRRHSDENFFYQIRICSL